MGLPIEFWCHLTSHSWNYYALVRILWSDVNNFDRTFFLVVHTQFFNDILVAIPRNQNQAIWCVAISTSTCPHISFGSRKHHICIIVTITKVIMSNLTSSSSEVELAVDGTTSYDNNDHSSHKRIAVTATQNHQRQYQQEHTTNESSPLLSVASSSSPPHHPTDPKKMKRLFLKDTDGILIQVRKCGWECWIRVHSYYRWWINKASLLISPKPYISSPLCTHLHYIVSAPYDYESHCGIGILHKFLFLDRYCNPSFETSSSCCNTSSFYYE